MQKDLKIGLGLGLAMVSAIALWLATRPSLTPEARMRHLYGAGARQGPAEQPTIRVTSTNPAPEPDAGQRRDLAPPSAQTSNDGPGTTVAQEPDNAPDAAARQQTEKIKTERFHIVRKDDTLSRISYRYYGSAAKWSKIFDANRQTIRDANKLTIGTKLIIPD